MSPNESKTPEGGTFDNISDCSMRARSSTWSVLRSTAVQLRTAGANGITITNTLNGGLSWRESLIAPSPAQSPQQTNAQKKK